MLAHNHPSGQVEPSTQDRRLTRDLSMSAAALGMRLVDHLIIGENRYFSFSESGLLARWQDEFESFRRHGG